MNKGEAVSMDDSDWSENTNAWADLSANNYDRSKNVNEWAELENLMANSGDSGDGGDGGNRNEKLLKRALLYRKVGRVALALSAIEAQAYKPSEDVPSEEERSDEKRVAEMIETLGSIEAEQADALISQIEAGLEEVDESLEMQNEWNIVNHKQINDRDSLEKELQSGTAIVELDIRFDKDGTPWISHSPRSGARFLFSKQIHEMTSEEVAAKGKRLSLEEGLEMIKKYNEDNPNHKVVIEIKELGPSKESAERNLENIQRMLEDTGLTSVACFATLSPDILKKVHDKFPDNPKILNGGIAPIISHKISEKSLEEGPVTKEFRVVGPGWDITFSDSTEYHEDRQDGYGKQTGYLWARLPKKTVAILSGLKKNGEQGAVSLAMVYMFADVLKKVNPEASEALLERYANHVKKLEVTSQVRAKTAEDILETERINKKVGNDRSVVYMNKKVYEAGKDLAEREKEGLEL